jgi:hypothetical protein
VVEPADLDAATVLQSLAMIDKFEGDFADVALVMDEATPEKQYTMEEIAVLKPEQYEDLFKVPGSFDEAWNHPCPFQQKIRRAGFTK